MNPASQRLGNVTGPKRILPKLLLAAASAFLAWNACALAIVGVTRLGNPELAVEFDSSDSKALAAIADAELLKIGNGERSNRSLKDVDDIIRRSLMREAINPRAVRGAGLTSELGHQKAVHTASLLAIAQSLTRRDLATNLWFIENEVNREDISGAMKYYDIALRTDEASQTLLFSILTRALDDEAIRVEFAKYVRAKPPWLSGMLNYSIANSEQPENVADAVERAGGMPVGLRFENLEQALIGRMIETSELESAKRFYLSTKGAQPGVLTSLEMTSETADPAKFPFTWGGTKSATVEGTFGANGHGNHQSLLGIATTGERGLIARKLLFLKPGSYEFTATRETGSMTVDSLATISAICLSESGAQQIWSGDLRSSRKFEILRIPESCSTQFFDITLYGGSGQTGAEITISALSLRKVA